MARALLIGLQLGPGLITPLRPPEKAVKSPEIIYSAISRHLMLDNASHLITSGFLTSMGSCEGIISGQASWIKVTWSQCYIMTSSLNAAPYTG